MKQYGAHQFAAEETKTFFGLCFFIQNNSIPILLAFGIRYKKTHVEIF